MLVETEAVTLARGALGIQVQQLGGGIAHLLRNLKVGWTKELRAEYFDWFIMANNEYSGGNSFKGYFFGNFSNSGLQSDNLTDDLKKIGLLRVNSVKKIWEAALSQTAGFASPCAMSRGFHM